VSGWRSRFGQRLRSERRRLSGRSYVVLVYHRFAGELKPGQERIDIAPRRFARQLRALRLAGFQPISPEEIIAFHEGGLDAVAKRGISITVDDAIADCVEPLRRHAAWQPQLFVPTAELGGVAHWIDGETVASWEQIAELARAGVRIGSHTRHHRRLTSLDAGECADELAGSRAELRERIPASLDVIAYPNGDHDAAVCRAARDAGYALAFTTEKGRNDAAADPFRLKRVSVHGDDGVLAILWKAWTGQGLPPAWLRLRSLLSS
jgi:peptidoglycan/xylan/chitin deacetylase (PgdA/CDA1 family)